MPFLASVESVRLSGEEPMWYAPVPQESMVVIRDFVVEGEEAAREANTPSDIVERPGEC